MTQVPSGREVVAMIAALCVGFLLAPWVVFGVAGSARAACRFFLGASSCL